MDTVSTSFGKLLQFKQYRLLYVGSTISLLGDLIFDVTVTIWLTSFFAPQSAEIAWIATLSGICIMAPLLLVSPVAGVFVDRWNKKHVLLATNLIQAVVISGLVLVALCAAQLPTGVIMACGLGALLVTNVASQFINPAKLVITSQAVPGDFRTLATSVTMTTTMTLSVVAPPLSGPLYAAAGATAALVINAASFAISLLFLSRLDVPIPTSDRQNTGATGVWKDLTEGFRFAWNDGPLRAMLILLFSISVAAGALNTSMVLFTLEVLSWPRETLGVLLAILGGSAALGSIAAPFLIKHLDRKRAFTLTLATLALGLTLMGLPLNTVATSLTGVAVCGAGSGMLNVFFGPLIMERVEPKLMGRVGSLLGPANGAGALLSMAAGGVFLAWAAGRTWTFAAAEFNRVHVLYLVCTALFSLACVMFGRRVFTSAAEPAQATSR